jgi:hypothetical protein
MEINPYDFPSSLGVCTRCRKDTITVGSVCVECMTPKEKKTYGIDKEKEEER